MTPQLYLLRKKAQSFLSRHHPVIFISAIALLIGMAVFMLYETLTLSLADASTGASTIGGFDQKTVDKIKDLHISNSTEPVKLVFPSPRPNPFVE